MNEKKEHRDLPLFHDKTKTLLRDLLDNVYHQADSNLAFYKVQKPDAIIPYTKFSTADMPTAIFQEGKKKQEINGIQKTEKTIYVLFHGFALPQEGHPMTEINRAVDIFCEKELPSINNQAEKTVDFYMLGLPTGGKVSSEWTEGLKKRGFSQHGEAYAKLLSDILPKESDETKIIFNAASMGKRVADYTLPNLPQLRNRLEYQCENPPLYRKLVPHIPLPLQPAALQTFLGYGAERLFINIRDAFKKRGSPVPDEELNNQHLPVYKIAEIPDDEEQRKLKMRSALFDALSIPKELPSEVLTFLKDIPTTIEQGLLDPISFSPRKLIDAIKKTRNKESLTIKQDNTTINFGFYAHTREHNPLRKLEKYLFPA